MKHDIRELQGYKTDELLTKHIRSGEGILYDADDDCEHEVVALWSGIACKKCGGWYCA